MRLLKTWVKAPFLKGASLLLLSECAEGVFPKVCKEFMKNRVVLTSCPEVENAEMIMGKLAAIITCANPKDVTVLTVEGSPHCLLLHAALNEALFITRAKVSSSHFVILEDKAIEISSESVRASRYLHLVQKCIQKCPDILKDLSRYSLEHSCSKQR